MTSASVVKAVRIVQIGVDAGDVNKLTWMVLKGNIDDGLEDTLYFLGYVLIACLSWSKAESTAFSCASWAASPAYWTNAISLS